MESITIITGASQNHFKTLCQFLESLKNIDIVYQCYVYDLGLEEESFNYIKEKFSTFIYKNFEYSKYPDYFNININAGEYAWKPVIIEEIAKEVKEGIILWCDAGSKVVSSFKPLYHIIKTQGIYTPTSRGFIPWLMHPKTLHYFSNEISIESLINKPNRAGGFTGFNLNNDKIMNLIEKYSSGAKTKECIAPEGSDRTNHRQDQSILAILYYNFMNFKEGENNILGISIHNDID
jgi:hypothetical protein